MRYQVGQSVRSVTDITTVIVIRAPDDDVELTCGGRPMVDAKTEGSTAPVAAPPRPSGGTLLGKRYQDPQASFLGGNRPAFPPTLFAAARPRGALGPPNYR